VAFDTGGNMLISDQVNGKVRRVDAATGLITTIAGVASGRGDNGPAVLASLNSPRGVAVGADGAIYIGDSASNKVRRVDPVSGTLSTFLGTGTSGNGINTANTANLTPISLPGCVAVNSSNTVAVADRGNTKIRQVDPTGNATTVANAGGGSGYSADGTFANGAGVFSNGGGNLPQATNTQGVNCVAIDNLGTVYVADTSNNVIRQIINGVVTTVVGYIVPSVNAAGVQVNTGVSGYVGDGGSPATQAQLAGPQGIGLNADGTQLCIADTGNHVVRQVDLVKNAISTIAGIPNDGSSDANLPIAGWQSRLNGPAGCAFDAAGNVFIADTGNNRVLRVDGKTGIMSLAAGGGTLIVSDGKPAATARVVGPVGIATDAAGNVYFTDRSGLVRKLTPAATTP
jgi:sugar lactone lactonase YvrE